MNESQLLSNFRRLHPEIERRFPQLERDAFGNKRLHLNCGAGTLMVDTAIEAQSAAGLKFNSLPGEVMPAERATRDLHARVRRTAADFLNAAGPDEISFHASSTAGLFNLAFGLRSILTPSNNVIVTDLDHMANVSPWETVWGEQAGCEVRRCGIDDRGSIDPERLLSLCDERTGLAAMTLASNAFGTIVPVKSLAAAIRRKSPRCLIVVDAVHHALHGPIDVQDMDCDFLVFSGYKVFGPMLGVLWGRSGLLGRLKPYRVQTNKDVPPYKFEQGTLNNSALASLLAALEYLAWVGERVGPEGASTGSDARRLFMTAMSAISLYDRELSVEVLKGFRRLDAGKFRCYGLIDPERSAERDPTFALEVAGLAPEDLKKKLWAGHALQIADGTHYSAAVVRHLGRSSIARVSLCHYHTLRDVKALISALEDLTA
jgi:selenocysteine lyase/cysteine desulfurase